MGSVTALLVLVLMLGALSAGGACTCNADVITGRNGGATMDFVLLPAKTKMKRFKVIPVLIKKFVRSKILIYEKFT